MGIIGLLIAGLIIGALARLIRPGKQNLALGHVCAACLPIAEERAEQSRPKRRAEPRRIER